MDIKKALLELVNSDSNIRHSYYEIEKLIVTMLEDYSKRNKKEFLIANQFSASYDAIFPDGIEDIRGKTAVDIKIYRNPHIFLRRIYDTVGRFSMETRDFGTLLLIIFNEIPDSMFQKIQAKRKNLNFDFVIWDLNKLVTIFSENEPLFEEIYNNIQIVSFKSVVSQALEIKKDSTLERERTYIEHLNAEYDKDNIVLFLGAGVSREAKVATWNTLISDLFVALIDKELATNKINIDDESKRKITNEIIQQNGSSPLLQTRFIRSGMADDFEDLLRDILYKNSEETSPLLEAIGQLCIPNRGKVGIQAIVNYNFDDLVEKNLKKLGVKYRSIYREGAVPYSDELGIFHVHGFLPQSNDEYEGLSKSLLVFSEEGYHKLSLEPYNWANINQINFLTNNTCVFIGLSMTDPNLRRLLEIVAQKNIDEDGYARHYVIMKRFSVEDNEKAEAIKSFEKVNKSLQEIFYKELGLNVIWIDEFSEITEIIRKIKSGYKQE